MGRSLSLAFFMMYARYAEGWFERKHKNQLAIRKDAPTDEQTRPDGQLIWLHTSSVSGTSSILKLCRRLTRENQNLTCLITTTSSATAEALRGQTSDRIVQQHLPAASTNGIGAFLDYWKPDLAVWSDTSFLPAFAVLTKQRNIPMVYIDANLSALAYRRWRIFGGMAASLLRRFDTLLAQDASSQKHYQRLGMPSGRVEVTGTLINGARPPIHDEMERKALARTINGRATWLAVSAHEGEEDAIFSAHQVARRSYPELLLIVVPRFSERGGELAAKANRCGSTVAQRSKGEELSSRTDVYVADTIDENGLWYRLAPVSFIGGSLVPAGGHNPFDAANLGSAILHGPETFHFADAYKHLNENNASIRVKNSADLAENLEKALSPERAAQLATAAWEVCSNGTTASDRAIELIQSYLSKDPS